MQELIDEMNKLAAEPIAAGELEQLRPDIAPEHEPIEARAHEHSDAVHAWLEAHDDAVPHTTADPQRAIAWFQYFIPAKIHRALAGLAADDADERDWPADHDGSAKVALLGIERSHAAWLELAHRGIASPAEVVPFIEDLIWLSDELEHVFPRARVIRTPWVRRAGRSGETAGRGTRTVMSVPEFAQVALNAPFEHDLMACGVCRYDYF